MQNLKPFFAAVMIMGKKPEPFLPACLESIRQAVDILVVNDNSGMSSSPNLTAVQNSGIYNDSRVVIIPSEFKGFGYCRNLCLDYLKTLEQTDVWVLYLDADEVHPAALPAVTRKIIPALPAEVGIVDGYFYQFFQSPRYYLSIDRRHNLFFRLRPDVRWDGQVHEKPVQLRGKRIAIPYCYYHYGYLINPMEIRQRWQLYGSLGDDISGAFTVEQTSPFKTEARMALPFTGRHPGYAQNALTTVLNDKQAYAAAFEQLARHNKVPAMARRLKQMNYALRLNFRIPEFFFTYGNNALIREGLGDILRDRRGS